MQTREGAKKAEAVDMFVEKPNLVLMSCLIGEGASLDGLLHRHARDRGVVIFLQHNNNNNQQSPIQFKMYCV
jgi:hypothetical protein